MLSTKQGSGLTSADLSVIFAKEVLKKKNQNKTLAKRANPTLMTYSDFLNVLMILAPKIYPSADPKNVFQKLLLENILPLAARRAPKSVEEHMEEGSEVWTLLFETLEDGLKGIFDYYTDLSDRRRKKIAAQEVQDQVKLKGGHGQVQTTSKQKAKLLRETKSLMGYVEYIQFCQVRRQEKRAAERVGLAESQSTSLPLRLSSSRNISETHAHATPIRSNSTPPCSLRTSKLSASHKLPPSRPETFTSAASRHTMEETPPRT